MINSKICITALTTQFGNTQGLFSATKNLRTLGLVQLLSAVPGGTELAADIIQKYLQNFNMPDSFNNNMTTALNLCDIGVSFNNTQCNILQNQSIQNTNILNTFQGINLALSAQNDATEPDAGVSRKRQAPDFDDYNVTSLKRIKSENVTTQLTVDEFTPFREYNNINLTEKDSTDPFQIIKTKWNIDQPSNPHVDHTHRIFSASGISDKSIRYKNDNQGFYYCKESLLITDANEPYVSCVKVFDDEIGELSDKLKRIDCDIITLYRNASDCVDYPLSCRITDEINELKKRENYLKNRYACLCDARDEIYSLYGNSEKSLHFNAKFITWDEVNIVKETRKVLGSYESFYGFSNR